MSGPSLRTLPAGIGELLDDFKDEIFSGLNAHAAGTIQSIDLGAGTCSISINYKRRLPGGASKSYPLLVDCPVFVLQGGGAFIEFPVRKGDFCLVLFNDRDIDTWWTSENVAEPNTARRHDLSDGFALVGINSKLHPAGLSGNVRVFGKSYPIELENDSFKLSSLVQNLISQIGSLIGVLEGINTLGSSSAQSLNPSVVTQLQSQASQFTRIGENFMQLLGGTSS